MIRRAKRQTKKRHSARWPEPVPRVRFRHNMTEVVWWEAPASTEGLVESTVTDLKGRTFWTGRRA